MLCSRHFNKTEVSPADDVKVTVLMETELMWHEQTRSIMCSVVWTERWHKHGFFELHKNFLPSLIYSSAFACWNLASFHHNLIASWGHFLEIFLLCTNVNCQPFSVHKLNTSTQQVFIANIVVPVIAELLPFANTLIKAGKTSYTYHAQLGHK